MRRLDVRAGDTTPIPNVANGESLDVESHADGTQKVLVWDGKIWNPNFNLTATVILNPQDISGGSTSSSSSSLTNYAQETGGNLDKVTTTLGQAGTGITPPTGGSGLLGFLSGAYQLLLNTLKVSIQNASLAVTQSGIWTTARSWTLSSSTDSVSVPLPPGASTDATLQQILAAIKASVSIADNMVLDPTVTPVAYYIMRESINEGTGANTITFETLAGTPVVPSNPSLLQPVSKSGLVIETSTYTATANGTGYASGDILYHTFGIDPTGQSKNLIFSFWMNAGPSVANGSILSAAPTSGTYVQASQQIFATSLPLPQGASTEATLQAIKTALGSPLQAGQIVGIIEPNGAPITGTSMPAGGVGLTGWLSAVFSNFASLVTTALGKASRVVLVDPITGNGSLVQAFHNVDNQSVGATAYGLMTGGVDQLLNNSGNLDRKRAVAGDGMAATGLSAEVPMLYNSTTQKYDRAPGNATQGALTYSFVPSTFVVGQTKIAATGTAVQLPSNTLVNGIVIKANQNNTNAIMVGNSSVTATNDGTGNGYPLWPGEGISIVIPNMSSVYINGTIGDFVAYEGN